MKRTMIGYVEEGEMEYLDGVTVYADYVKMWFPPESMDWVVLEMGERGFEALEPVGKSKVSPLWYRSFRRKEEA